MTAPSAEDLSELETFIEGQRVVFRPIRPNDKQRLSEGLERLSPQSRYRRFFRHVDHLSDKELRYLTEVDFVDHVAWIAGLGDEQGEPAVGVARWIRIVGDTHVAEGAVTVIDDWHGRGIGKTLLFLLARSARSRDVHAFRAWVMGDNRPILGVIGDLGVKRGKWEGGVVQIDVPLPEKAEDLANSAAPLVLREVARGRLQGEARPDGGRGTRLRGHDGV